MLPHLKPEMIVLGLRMKGFIPDSATNWSIHWSGDRSPCPPLPASEHGGAPILCPTILQMSPTLLPEDFGKAVNELSHRTSKTQCFRRQRNAQLPRDIGGVLHLGYPTYWVQFVRQGFSVSGHWLSPQAIRPDTCPTQNCFTKCQESP